MFLPKEKMLFISLHLPSLDVPQAGQKIAYKNLMDFKEQYEIILISFVNILERQFLNVGELEKICSEVYTFNVSNWTRMLGIIFNPLLPLHVAARLDSKVQKLICRLIKKHLISRVHFEYSQSLAYLPEINTNLNTTVVIHDVLFQMVERKARSESSFLFKWLWGYLFSSISLWELRAYQKADKIYVLSEKDKLLLLSLDQSLEDKIAVKLPFISTAWFNENTLKFEGKEKAILFWGAMDRVENQEAVCWFYRDIWPFLKERHPTIKFYVVGNNPPAKIKDLQTEKDIVVTGFVDNPSEYFDRCMVGIAPLISGAGVKIKTLELMYYGLPVVSTSVGAEGIPIAGDHGLLVTDDVKNFFEEVNYLFECKERCLELGIKAHEAVKIMLGFS